MNILFLSKDYPPNMLGGVGTYIYEVSRLLARMGHRTFVITKADDAPIDYQDSGVSVYRVKPRKFNFCDGFRHKIGGFLERLEYSLAVSRKIKEIHRRFRIDLIESSEARAEGFWYYLLNRRPPLVIKLHTPETVAFKLDHTPVTFDYRLIKLLEEYWIKKASQQVGLSKEVVDLTNDHFSIHLANIPLVPNPIDLSLFSPSQTGNNAGIQEILYVGRLEFRKGVHVLIRAMAYIEEHAPGARLTFVGSDCGMRGYLEQKRLQLKFPENISFVEQLPRRQLVEYYQRSTVCVIPSIWENYPYVCLEAMACGKPVVASNIGGLKDMIADRESGILVSAGSSLELGQAIVSLLKDEHLSKSIAIKARRTIEERYSPEKIARQTLEVYEGLIQN